METEPKTLVEVFAAEAIKIQKKQAEAEQIKDGEEWHTKLTEVINRDPSIAVKSIADLVSSLPEKIRTQEDVSSGTTIIKNIKVIIKVAKNGKKEAEAPFEEARKNADIALKEARDGKKTAGARFEELIDTAEALERRVRDSISEYSNYLAHKQEEETKREQEALKAAANAQIKAQEAIEEFSQTGDVNALANADALMNESKKKIQEAQEAELAAREAPTQTITGVGLRKDITFEIENIDVVPSIYFNTFPDMEEISKKVTEIFPGMKITINSVEITDMSKCLTAYLIEDLDRGKILEAYKADEKLVIPGLKRSHKSVPIVR